MKALRIAFLLGTSGKTWGGMEQHTLDLARSLAARGHNVHLLAHPQYRARANADSLTFHPQPMNLGRNNPWLRYRIRRTLRRLQADVCHAQGNKAAALLSLARRSSRHSLCVGTVHGIKSSHRAFDRLDGVIAVSQSILATLTHPRKTCIYNGLTDQPGPISTGAPDIETDVRPLVVAIGRLEPVKGFDNLLRAWQQAGQPGHLVIIGGGSQSKHLNSLRQTLALQGSVTLTGQRDDVAGWLGQADACVISSHREGFPYVLVEALHAQCPVLATPVGGPAELLPPASLAADTSTAALAQLLRVQLTELTALRNSQRPAFDFARTHLTIEAMTDHTEAFYRSLSTSG